MDLKGITWAGNIYQKFEAMCLEVEEVMYQDTVKYLENQAQTVGAGLKKFYSEVMQDFVPPPDVDPVKVAAADLPINLYSHSEVTKKPKKTINEDPTFIKRKKSEDCKVMGDISAERAANFGELDGVIHHAPICHGDIGINLQSGQYPGKRKSGGLHRRLTVRSKGIREGDIPSKISASATHVSGVSSNVSSFRQMRERCEMHSASVEAYDAGKAEATSCNSVVYDDVCTSSAPFGSPPGANLSMDAVVPKQVDSLNSFDIDSNSEKSPLSGSNVCTTICESAAEAIMSCEGRSENSNKDAASDGIELEIIERLAESKFEETCVLVEGNELRVLPQTKGKPKSYKKKLRQAFPLKMKSTSRKQEYEKLAAQHSIQASKPEGKEQVIPACTEDPKLKSLHAEYITESEWELL